MAKSLSKQLQVKRNIIKDLEKEINLIREDRRKYRDHYVKMLKWHLKAVGENRYISSSDYLIDLAKLFNNVESWYWS